jgi:hypothetical protein
MAAKAADMAFNGQVIGRIGKDQIGLLALHQALIGLRASSFCHRAGAGRLAGQGALLDDLITIVMTGRPVDLVKPNCR